MTPTNAPVVELLNRFVLWAETQPDIRLLMVIGSRARSNQPADAWSDVDLIVAAHNPQPYLQYTDWLKMIGPVWVTHVEPTLAGVRERRVMFEGGYDFDLIFVADGQFGRLVHDPEVSDVIRRGVRILVDKDRIMTRITLPIGGRRPYEPPTEAEFTNLVNDFWYHAVWTTKKLRRGELWTAIHCCDGYMKHLLRQMLEWHTHAVGPGNHDTWFNGRFVEQWAEPRAIEQMREAFAHYSPADVARALQATMALFRRVATETAAQLNYAYPFQSDAHVNTWVNATLSATEA